MRGKFALGMRPRAPHTPAPDEPLPASTAEPHRAPPRGLSKAGAAPSAVLIPYLSQQMWDGTGPPPAAPPALRSLRPPRRCRRRRPAPEGCGQVGARPCGRGSWSGSLGGARGGRLRICGGAARRLRGAAVRRWGGVRESDGAPCPPPAPLGASRNGGGAGSGGAAQPVPRCAPRFAARRRFPSRQRRAKSRSAPRSPRVPLPAAPSGATPAGGALRAPAPAAPFRVAPGVLPFLPVLSFPIPRPIRSWRMSVPFCFSPLLVARISLRTRCAGLTLCPRSSSLGAGDGSAPPRRAPLARLRPVRRDVCPLSEIGLSSGSLREGTRSAEPQPRSSLPPRCSVPARGRARRRAPAVPGCPGRAAPAPTLPSWSQPPEVPGERCDSFSFSEEMGVCVYGCWR